MAIYTATNNIKIPLEVVDLEVTLEVWTSKVILKLVMGFAVYELLFDIIGVLLAKDCWMYTVIQKRHIVF